MSKWQWLFDGDESPRQFATRREMANALGVSESSVVARIKKGIGGDADLAKRREHLASEMAVVWTHIKTAKPAAELTLDDLYAEDDETRQYTSTTALAKEIGVARTTMQLWLARGYTSTREAVMASGREQVEYRGVQYKSLNAMAEAMGVTWETAQRRLKGKPAKRVAKPKTVAYDREKQIKVIRDAHRRALARRGLL